MSNGEEQQHEIADLRRSSGELSFEARIGPTPRQIWFRTETDTVPAPEAALAACLMPAMRLGGSLHLPEPISPRVLRSQPEFQAIQRAWSRDWSFNDQPLREVEVVAPARPIETSAPGGRVAAFFSGGVDSWGTVLSEPDLTDLIFIEGFDLRPGEAHHAKLSGEVESRLRATAAELGLPLHVVRTNLRELSDPLIGWEGYYGCALVAVAFLFEPIFDRVLIAGEFDYEVQEELGASLMVDTLWSTEALEIVDAGGRLNRVERTRLVAEHPAARRSLRVCWQNPGGAYNCGRCSKCLRTMVTLEALGLRDGVETFPSTLDLDAIKGIDLAQPSHQTFWEDVLDATRAAGRVDLERAVEEPLQRAKRERGLHSNFRRRPARGPAPSVRIAVIVPAWKQADYLAGAVGSALAQEAPFGVGVTIVDDGCPDPETERIGQALRDANPDRVEFVRQANAGVAAARNAGVHRSIRRWPGVEAFFFLDADNLLSPQTLSDLWETLEKEPDAAWASPALEVFGSSEEGGWNVLGPHLPYRQLFANQSDAGTLVRRDVFEAGVEFDETMRLGFEDWEFFLRASLAGFRGRGAGRRGFRYRRVGDSMLTAAQEREERIKADIRHRHQDAYRAGALCRREHEEAPRFALVRCDRGDALLLAAADLEPRRVPLLELCGEEQVAGAVLLTTAANLDRLREGSLAGILLRLQLELHEHPVVALDAEGGRIGIAAMPAALASLRMPAGDIWIERHLELPGAVPEPLPTVGRIDPLGPVLDCLCAVPERPTHRCGAALDWRFFQYQHFDRLDTTVPWAGGDGGRTLLAVAPESGGQGWDAMMERIVDARAHQPDLAAHLVLTETALTAEAPAGPFDTQSCLGGAAPESVVQLVERLQAGADLVEEPIAGGGDRPTVPSEKAQA